MPTFAKYNRTSSRPSLISGKKTETRTQEIPHNEYPIHGINASRHKLGVFVGVFEIVLLSPTPRQRLSFRFGIYQRSRGYSTLTVPYSRYTAEPVAATAAPTNHMVNAIPTLPADFKMTLGVA